MQKFRYYFYKLKYGEDDDQQYLLGGAGPFSLNSTDLSTKDAEGFIYDEENFDESKIIDQLDALIQQMKDYAKYQKENADGD